LGLALFGSLELGFYFWHSGDQRDCLETFLVQDALDHPPTVPGEVEPSRNGTLSSDDRHKSGTMLSEAMD
jgi:hypothetical protein